MCMCVHAHVSIHHLSMEFPLCIAVYVYVYTHMCSSSVHEISSMYKCLCVCVYTHVSIHHLSFGAGDQIHEVFSFAFVFIVEFSSKVIFNSLWTLCICSLVLYLLSKNMFIHSVKVFFFIYQL